MYLGYCRWIGDSDGGASPALEIHRGLAEYLIHLMGDFHFIYQRLNGWIIPRG